MTGDAVIARVTGNSFCHNIGLCRRRRSRTASKSRPNLVKNDLTHYNRDKSRGGCRGWFPGQISLLPKWGGAAMCDDQAADPAGTAEPELSRRGFLRTSAVVAGAAALFEKIPRLALRSSARAVTADGSSAYSMAM